MRITGVRMQLKFSFLIQVFQVFLKWSEELKSGLLSSEDIKCLKDNLLRKDFMVLPTVQDKWVSLNPSFGIICWCDDDKLKKEFKHYQHIDFLYFGELIGEEKELLHSKISTLMQKLGIPAISEVCLTSFLPLFYLCTVVPGSFKKWC